MHAVRITGYAYGQAQAIDFVVTFYCYSAGGFYSYSWTNFGSFHPGTVKLSYAGNSVKIWWSTLIYFPSYEVFASTHSGYGLLDSDFEGWTLTDAVAPVSNVVTVNGSPNKPNGLTMYGNVSLNGYWLSGDGGSKGIYVDAFGKIGVQKSDPSYTIDVAGDIRADYDIYAGSDLFVYDNITVTHGDLKIGTAYGTPAVLYVNAAGTASASTATLTASSTWMWQARYVAPIW